METTTIKHGATILVTGATGRQGGSVTRALLAKGYVVRALTRDMSSPRASTIKKLGAELVPGNFSDAPSLGKAMKGVDGVFVMTTPFEGGVAEEVRQGTNVVKAAQQAGVARFVMSSVASADKHTGIPHFDSKYEVEKVLSKSGLPFTIIAPVAFMENILTPMQLPSLKSGLITSFVNVDAPQQVMAVEDIGWMAAAVFARGKSTVGQRIDIASDAISAEDMAGVLAKITGREFKCVRRDAAALAGMPPDYAKMIRWMVDVGYRVDIPRLHGQFSEVPWHTFTSWAKEQDWTALLREGESAFT